MKKTILTLVMTLVLMAPTLNAVPIAGADSVINEKIQSVERVRERINQTLDDTIASKDGSVVSVGHDVDLTADDIKAMSDKWADVFENVAYGSIWAIIALVLMVLLFRYLTRSRRYRVMEQAIINKYPLDELQLNDSRRSTVYVQQPVYPVSGPAATAPQAPAAMSAMPNWRALMPAVKWIAWGMVLTLFGVAIGDLENPFWPVGLALIFVGVCKGYILHKEQKVLQQAWERNASRPMPEPMREGIPVPPPMSQYHDDVSAND